MKLAQQHKVVPSLSCMSFDPAATVTTLILENRFRRNLALGSHHGVSTCVAGAVPDLGGGRITTIDLMDAGENQPGVDELDRSHDTSLSLKAAERVRRRPACRSAFRRLQMPDNAELRCQGVLAW